MSAPRESEMCGRCRARQTAHHSGLCSRCRRAWPEADEGLLDVADVFGIEESRELREFPLGKKEGWMEGHDATCKGCDCLLWASADILSTLPTGHHENCPRRPLSPLLAATELIRELALGMEAWAARNKLASGCGCPLTACSRPSPCSRRKGACYDLAPLHAPMQVEVKR